MTVAQLTALNEETADAGDNGVRSAARGSALNMVGAITGSVVGFITIGVVTNGYGRAGAGLFFTATALFTLAANACRLGGESGLTLFVSRQRATGSTASLPSLIGTAAGTTLVVSGGLAVVGFASAPWLAELLVTGEANQSELARMIRVLAVAMPTFAVSQVLFGASRGFGTMRPSVLSGQILRPLAQLLLVAVALLVSTAIWPVAVAWAVASALAGIAITAWLAARLKGNRGDRLAFPRSTYWRFAGPRALTDLLASALERLDVLLVAYFLSETDVGIYGASNRLLIAGQLLMYATAQSMAPHLSRAFLERRHDEARHLLSTISAWSTTLLWPIAFVLFFGAGTVLEVFGPGFAEGADVVRILVLALALIVALGTGDTLLTMTGDSVASLVNHVAGLILMVGASALLLPRVGIIGAAWAWALSRLLVRVLSVSRVWKTTGVHGLGRPVATAALLATTAFVPSGFVIYRLVDNGLLALVMHIGLGGLAHVLLGMRFRHQLRFDQLQLVLGTGRTAAPAVEVAS